MKQKKSNRRYGAARHISGAESQVYNQVNGVGFRRGPNQAEAGTEGGNAPDGAMGAWEYWGNQTYYETGPDGSYTGNYWHSDGP